MIAVINKGMLMEIVIVFVLDGSLLGDDVDLQLPIQLMNKIQKRDT